MSRSEIEAALREVFADLFNKAPESFSSATSPDNLPEWDSLAHVRLIAALEERFGLFIPPEDQADMVTFELVTDVLSDRLA